MFPYIHGNIEYFPGNDADEFPLRLLDLVMQASQRPVTGFGMIILYEIHINANIPKPFFLITFQKKTPLILENCGLNELHIRNGGRDYLQM